MQDCLYLCCTNYFSPAAAENICPVMIVQVVASSDKVSGKGSPFPISNTLERYKEVQPGEEFLSCTGECYNVGLWICHHYWEEEEKLVLASVEQGKHCVWWDAAAGGKQEQRLNKTWELLCCSGCCTQSSVCYMRRELCPPTASIEGAPGPGFCPAEQWPSGIYPCGVSLLCSVALRQRHQPLYKQSLLQGWLHWYFKSNVGDGAWVLH